MGTIRAIHRKTGNVWSRLIVRIFCNRSGAEVIFFWLFQAHADIRWLNHRQIAWCIRVHLHYMLGTIRIPYTPLFCRNKTGKRIHLDVEFQCGHEFQINLIYFIEQPTWGGGGCLIIPSFCNFGAFSMHRRSFKTLFPVVFRPPSPRMFPISFRWFSIGPAIRGIG